MEPKKVEWTPEMRRKQSERMKEVRAKGRPSSTSTPSKGSASSSVPPVLPPNGPTSSQGWERLAEAMKGTTTATRPSLKALPDDRDELLAEIALAKFPARVMVSAVSEVYLTLDFRELTEAEEDEGIHAFACLLWQLGLYKNGLVLVGLWLLGTLAPRMADRYRERKALREGKSAPQRRERRDEAGAPDAAREAAKEVKAVAASISTLSAEIAALREAQKANGEAAHALD